MGILISILLGVLPEVLYFTLFLVYTKNIKEKKVKLFFLIALAYVLCIMISQYKIIYYVAFAFIIYLILKILYKEDAQIIDVFIIMYSCFYITLLSYLIYFANNLYTYIICYIINRFLLFAIFIFRKYFNEIYKKYYKFWNRNDNIKRPIKSITLRNISLIVINCIIFFMNIICLYMINLSLK